MGLEKNMNPLLLQRPGGCIYLVLVGEKKKKEIGHFTQIIFKISLTSQN